MKEFLLHKLTLRVAYITAAFLSTKVLLLLNDPHVQKALQNVFINPMVKPGALEWLKTTVGLGIMVGGEFVYHWWHEKFVIPQVTTKSEVKS
jgi:hypothetical protein